MTAGWSRRYSKPHHLSRIAALWVVWRLFILQLTPFSFLARGQVCSLLVVNSISPLGLQCLYVQHAPLTAPWLRRPLLKTLYRTEPKARVGTPYSIPWPHAGQLVFTSINRLIFPPQYHTPTSALSATYRPHLVGPSIPHYSRRLLLKHANATYSHKYRSVFRSWLAIGGSIITYRKCNICSHSNNDTRSLLHPPRSLDTRDFKWRSPWCHPSSSSSLVSRRLSSQIITQVTKPTSASFLTPCDP